MNIICGNCKKDSGVAYTDQIGKDAAKVQHEANFVVKLPILFGLSTWLFACSADCMRVLFEAELKAHNVSEETKAEAKKVTDDFKAKIPEYAEQTAKFMGNLQTVLKFLVKKNESEEKEISQSGS